MTTERVRKLYEGQPFRPFVFHLADGRDIPVPHRDFMYITPPGRTVIVSDDDGAVNIIDLLSDSGILRKPRSVWLAANELRMDANESPYLRSFA
jgi:hypothetical protein